MLTKQEIAAIVQQFYFGENDGAKLIHELPAFAPGEHEQKFCAVWEADEQKHDRLFHEILPLYDIDPKGFNELFSGLFSIAWKCVEEKDWTKCMMIACCIENIALVAGEFMHEHGDNLIKNVLSQILPDEKKHLGFTQQQLEKAAKIPSENVKIKEVLKKVKLLSFRLGKKNLFNTYDLIISNDAEKRLLTKMKEWNIHSIHLENKNGYWRNLFWESVLQVSF